MTRRESLKKTRATFPQRFSSGTSVGRTLRGNGKPRFTWKTTVKAEVSVACTVMRCRRCRRRWFQSCQTSCRGCHCHCPTLTLSHELTHSTCHRLCWSIVGFFCYVHFLFCTIIMAALRSRCGHYIFVLWLLLSFLSSPNLSRRRLDVYHTSTHGVAVVQISNVGLKRAACSSLKIQDAKNRHLGTIAQLTRTCIDEWKKSCYTAISPPHVVTIW